MTTHPHATELGDIIKNVGQLYDRAVMLNGMIEAADVLFEGIKGASAPAANGMVCLLSHLCTESQNLAVAIEALEDALKGEVA